MRWAVVAALAVLLTLPAVLSSYAVTIFILIFFYGFLGQAWNIVGGYAGQLSVGHAAFVGVGGYTAAMLSIEAGLTPWVGMFVGAALAALLGAIIGYLGFRFGLRGFYFVLLTVAFAEICRIAVSNIDAIGGPLGLYITFTGDPRQFQFQDGRVYYYIALALMLAATATAWAIERRRFGIYLAAIREDEAAAEALGVNALKYKMLAMVVSSFLTGLGGTFYAFYLFSLQPNTLFGIPLSVEIIIRPIVGGAGTVLGTEAAARAAPDGNTVLLVANSFVINPALKRGNYDVATSFEPVCYLASTPMVLVVQGSSPYKTLNDLIAAAKTRPGQVVFASGGPASSLHVAIEVLKRAAGIEITYVPYGGTAPSINALMGGHVTAVWADYPTVVSQLQSGTLRGLVTASEKRVPTLPDVPTLTETGITRYNADIFYGMVAPAKTPANELAKLSK